MTKTKKEHNHHHHDIQSLSGKRLLLTFIVNFIIALSEIIGGIISGSLALISDSLHNINDSFAILIAYLSNKISKKDANLQFTFGYKRSEILAALINSISLFAISIFLFKEAYNRFSAPKVIDTDIGLIIAIIGLMANIFGVILLNKDKKHNLNIKAAYLHLIIDSLSSVAVIISMIIIKLYKLYIIDPILTILIGVFVIRESYKLLTKIVKFLLMAAPEDIPIKNLKKKLEQIPQILNIHHIHLWNMNDKEIHFEAHVELPENMTLQETDKILNKIEQILEGEFNIHHITIQFESDKCRNKSIINKSNNIKN